MKSLIIRFIAEENGSDLIEYGLLTAFLGLAGIGGFDLVTSALGTTYTSWETGVNALWHPAEPGSASSITSQ